MLHWIITNKFRDESNSALHPIQPTYQALLSSTIADGDAVTDWIYYINIFKNNEEIPKWLITMQLDTFIFGTLLWLSVATDGRGGYWEKDIFLWMINILIIIALGIILFRFTFLVLIPGCCSGMDCKVQVEWLIG